MSVQPQAEKGYEFTWNNFKDDPLNFLGNGLSWSFSPLGSGENAMAPAQIGLTGLGLLQRQKQFNQQLNEARRQFAFSKGNTQANFMNQGTNYINQGLFQLEGLRAFNPEAAVRQAENFGAAVDQLNQAGSRLELGDHIFAPQQNALQKYSQLAVNQPQQPAPTEPRLA